MADSTQAGTPSFWGVIVTEGPGFVYGFVLGVVSGYFGNWAWEKFKPRRRKPHISIEMTDDGTFFTGNMSEENSKKVLSLMRAAAAKPSSKVQRGSSYQSSGKSTE